MAAIPETYAAALYVSYFSR